MIEKVAGDRERVLATAAAAHGAAAAQDPVDRALVEAAGGRDPSDRLARYPSIRCAGARARRGARATAPG